ncbi:VOC family protein [Sphingomonas sp.]|uniref:VOC family protein n=1 Tax=Sphingomonas sp. TaxID=28214 RepID=UPI0025D219DA|nr:glyoxalase/bleomycin resistance/extradiol dioxygenase family protein [Sphingomonas sp.]
MPDPMPSLTSGLTPHIVIRDGGGASAIDFYKAAFGAIEHVRLLADQPIGTGAPMAVGDKRIMHAHLVVNGGSLILNDDFPDFRGGATSPPPAAIVLHLHVDDADAWFERAVAAGATVKMPLQDMFWGDRYGHVEDPFGYIWAVAAAIKK